MFEIAVENAYKNMDFEKTLKDNLEKVNTFINEQVVPAAKSTMNSLADMYNKATTNGTNGSGSGGLSDSAHRKRKPSEKPHNEFYEYLVV